MCQWSHQCGTGTLPALVIDEQALSELDAEQLRQVSQRLLAELRHQRALNEKLTMRAPCRTAMAGLGPFGLPL